MNAEIKIKIDGEEYVPDKFRMPKEGEYYINNLGEISKASLDPTLCNRIILKPKANFRDYTLELAQKHYRWGATIPARFRNDEGYNWQVGLLLVCYSRDNYPFQNADYSNFRYCQILIPSDGGEV